MMILLTALMKMLFFFFGVSAKFSVATTAGLLVTNAKCYKHRDEKQPQYGGPPGCSTTVPVPAYTYSARVSSNRSLNHNS